MAAFESTVNYPFVEVASAIQKMVSSEPGKYKTENEDSNLGEFTIICANGPVWTNTTRIKCRNLSENTTVMQFQSGPNQKTKWNERIEENTASLIIKNMTSSIQAYLSGDVDANGLAKPKSTSGSALSILILIAAIAAVIIGLIAFFK